MDEENKQENQPPRQHVHIFGAEVNSGSEGNGNEAAKEEWRARKEEWKRTHHAERAERHAEWRAQRDEWRRNHYSGGGSMFWGLVLLLVGMFALLGTFGYLSPVFWHAILPFWPLLIILWGASLVLGRHWFARFILFIFALIFLIIVIMYGLVRAGSPLVSSLSPNVVRAVQTAHPSPY